MKDASEPDQTLAALSRWRDSCIFYFKFDIALVIAIATVVSFFNLRGLDLIATAYQYKVSLYYLILLIIYAFVFELCITHTSNLSDLAQLLANAKHRKIVHRVFSLGYLIQVLAHIWLLVGALGFAGGYVDGFMAACHLVAGKCVGT